MRKEIMYLTISILLSGIVYAIPTPGGNQTVPMPFDENQIITQGQLDAINVTSVDLRCRSEGQPYLRIETLAINVIFPTSCLNIQRQGPDYLILRKMQILKIRLSDYLGCLLEQDATFCNAVYQASIQRDYDSFKNAISKKIRAFQTQEPIQIPESLLNIRLVD